MVRFQVKGGVWKNSEDEILKSAVMKYGKNHWARVASLMTLKTAKQCKARWYEWLDPSIKKTEWTREEDERLLHLAKLMPTQWRTIAPAVGRTANQCIERYDQLLDQAAEKSKDVSSKSRSALESLKDLKTGDADVLPETRPAKPDPIDMDDEEKEMLNEARARLANTRGKKARRKARERQLETGRRMALLQKRREMRAAGIVHSFRSFGDGSLDLITGRHKNSSWKKRRRYGTEIDFVGEIPFERQVPLGFFDASKEDKAAEEMRSSKEARKNMVNEMNKRRTAAQEKRGTKRPLSEEEVIKREMRKLEKEAQEELWASRGAKKAKLVLPVPVLDDMEVEEIGKSLGNDSLMRAHEGVRTEDTGDVVLEEAKNAISRTNMVAPLLETEETEVAPLAEGTGYEGIVPKTNIMDAARSEMRSVLTSARSVAAKSVFDSKSAGGSRLKNEMILAGKSENTVLTEGENTKSSRKNKRQRSKLRFDMLPKPKDEYEMVAKSNKKQEKVPELLASKTLDSADVKALNKRKNERKRNEEHEMKSEAVKRDLPLPVVTKDVLVHIENLTNLSVDEIIKREMVSLIVQDQMQHGSLVDKELQALVYSDIVPVEDVNFKYLREAKEMIKVELGSENGFKYKESIDRKIADYENERRKAVDRPREYTELREKITQVQERVDRGIESLAESTQTSRGKLNSALAAKYWMLDSDFEDQKVKVALYKSLVSKEKSAIQERININAEALKKLQEVEMRLQKSYADAQLKAL